MSIIVPAGTGQSPDTITRTSPIVPAGTAQFPDTVTRTSPIAPAATPTIPTAADNPTTPQPINQNGTAGTLVNTST
jgi:hypothetical protein